MDSLLSLLEICSSKSLGRLFSSYFFKRLSEFMLGLEVGLTLKILVSELATIVIDCCFAIGCSEVDFCED